MTLRFAPGLRALDRFAFEGEGAGGVSPPAFAGRDWCTERSPTAAPVSSFREKQSSRAQRQSSSRGKLSCDAPKLCSCAGKLSSSEEKLSCFAQKLSSFAETQDSFSLFLKLSRTLADAGGCWVGACDRDGSRTIGVTAAGVALRRLCRPTARSGETWPRTRRSRYRSRALRDSFHRARWKNRTSWPSNECENARPCVAASRSAFKRDGARQPKRGSITWDRIFRTPSAR